MQHFSPNPFTRSLCSLVFCAALCFTSQRTYADLTNDVERIADILEAYGSGNIGLWTYPRGTAGINLSRYLWAGLFDYTSNDGTPQYSHSYLRQIYDRLLLIPTNAPSVTVTNAVDLSRIENLLDYLQQSLDLHTYGLMWHTHLDDEQFEELLASLGAVSNGLSDVSAAVYSVNDAIVDGFASVDLSPVTRRQDDWYTYVTDADSVGQEDASALGSDVATAEAEDASTIAALDHETLEGYETEPELPEYTPASDADTADANKDSLLDSLRNDDLSHSPVLTLVSASDFRSVTGTDGSMVYNLAEGPVYTFIGNLGTICSAAWYGLLSVFSALLFWRKQNEISGIVRATNFSRV